jgi:Bifunctional DNA primase/polymerase, N-terminal
MNTMNLNTMQRAGLQARERDWPVIPLAPGTKNRPLVEWTPYQTRLPTELELVRWFNDPTTNMAVITGQVSSGLIIVDCDDSAPDADWTQTVVSKSGREEGVGYHFFYRSIQEAQTQRFEWGEIRGERSYTVIPPSVHPSGKKYSWYISPDQESIGVLPKDLVAAASTVHHPARRQSGPTPNGNTYIFF